MATTTINPEDVRRHGRLITLGQGRTAKETYIRGMDGLIITDDSGNVLKEYRGSSLGFSDPLTDEDKQYLASLGSDKD